MIHTPLNITQNGPGVFDIPRKHKKTFTFRHWFDGLTVMHKFAIHNGTVTYRNRHLNTPIEEWIAKGHDPPRGFGQDPCRNIFSRLFSVLLGHGMRGVYWGLLCVGQDAQSSCASCGHIYK